ncbi:MAG: hypothetical protein ACMXYB_01665 [Candidatus Woesearchaeota archaeon]
MIIILLLLSYSYSQFASTQTVCCYQSQDSDQSGVIRTAFHSNCQSSGGISLGIPSSEHSLETGNVQGIPTNCGQLVVDNGRECVLSTGELNSNRFFFNFNGQNYPSVNSCVEFRECSTQGCSWQGITPSTQQPTIGDARPSIGGDLDFDMVDGDFIEEGGINLGLSPFSTSSMSSCYESIGPFRGSLMSRTMCERIGTDCVYDPLRVGILTQKVGDYDETEIFSDFNRDTMCVSKTSSIRMCEGINSRVVCENYQSRLNPNEGSLMQIYGCEWRELNQLQGTCITKDLYFENLGDVKSKSINVTSAIRRENFVKNPVFQVRSGSTLDFWNGSGYQIRSTQNFNYFLGETSVFFPQEAGFIEQQISAIPVNSNLELKVFVSGSVVNVFFDEEFIPNLEYEEGDFNPYLVSRGEFNSDIKVLRFEVPNSVETANRILRIEPTGRTKIFGVSLALMSGDLSSTLQNPVQDINHFSSFPPNSFNCNICSQGIFAGLCSEQTMSQFGNCELISQSFDTPYRTGLESSINPYTTSRGMANIFLEEDMVFCGLYTSRSRCEGDNKLNSQISKYHLNQNGLCKWISNPSYPNGGTCVKDSTGDGNPDTFNNGGRLSFISSSSGASIIDNYNFQTEHTSLNDFQLSCDSYPPSIYIELYKSYIGDDAELRTDRTSLPLVSEKPGVIRYAVVRIENQISPACNVFENFNSTVRLILELDGQRILTPLATSLFPEYNGAEFFQTVYTNEEFRSKFGAIDLNTLDNFISRGTIRAIDSSGNVQKNRVSLRGGKGIEDFMFELKTEPQTYELYSFSKLYLDNIQMPIEVSDLRETCSVILADLDNDMIIGQFDNISLLDLRDEGFEIGAKYSAYANQERRSDFFNISYQVSCQNIFDQHHSVAQNRIFSTRDELIILSFGSEELRNSDNVPFFDLNSYELNLEFRALEGVSCSLMTLVGDSSVEASVDAIIKEPVELSSQISPNYSTHPLYFNKNLNLEPFLQRGDSSYDGTYRLTLVCNLLNDRPFEKELFFELNSYIPDISEFIITHIDDKKWVEINNQIYIDALGENLLSSDNSPINEKINNYIRNNLKLNSQDSQIDFDTIREIKLCDIEIPKNTLRINQNLFSLTESANCNVFYDSELSSIILETRLEIQTNWGTLNSKVIRTNLETKEPNINIRTRDGTSFGRLIENNLYYKGDNPEILIDLGLSEFREFSCDITPIVNGFYLDSSSFESSSSSMRFTLAQILTSDAMNNLDNIDIQMELECIEHIFNKKLNLEVSLIKDEIIPEIESIEFIGLGDNWVYPSHGTPQINSDIQIDFSRTNNFVSCQVLPVFDSNPIAQHVNIKSVKGRDTSSLVLEDVLTLVRRNNDLSPLVSLSNSNVINNVDFYVSVRCENGAGGVGKRNFSQYSLNLFDFGSVNVRGKLNNDKRLNLEIDTLANLGSSIITIRDRNSDSILFNGPLSSLNSEISTTGSINRYFIRGIDIEAQDLEDSPSYPLNIEFIIGEQSLSTDFNILVDNTNPEVFINLNSNDDSVVFENFISGEIIIRESPEFSKGISELSIQFRKGSEVISEIIEMNYNDLSYSIALNEVEGFQELEVGSYSIRVSARDYFGNLNISTKEFEVSDEIFISLLSSINVGLYDFDPSTWYTISEFPVLSFESTRDLQSCSLMPGSSRGYIGGVIPFENLGSNVFELNTSDHRELFEIIDGKKLTLISCQRSDRDEEFRVGVNLYKMNILPDYVLSFDWGVNQIIPPNRNSRTVNFSVIQKSDFRDVSCKVNVRGQSIDKNLDLVSSTGIGNFRGSVDLPAGDYMFFLECMNPVEQNGIVKSYNVNIAQEAFRIDIISVEHTGLGFKNDKLNSNVVEIPSQISTQPNKDLKVRFTNNNQAEMICTIDTTKSGVVNFLISLFRNTRTATNVILQGVYEGIVEIDETTNEIRIECRNEDGRFSSRTFRFPIEYIDSSQYSIGQVNVEGER